jgi:hypothetical protein
MPMFIAAKQYSSIPDPLPHSFYRSYRYEHVYSILPVPSSPDPCTVENLLPLLRSIASEWLSLGEALSIDDDDLDIINTNNETDEACLQNMLEFHVEKSSQHTWKVMAIALKQIDQEELAKMIYGLYVESCKQNR